MNLREIADVFEKMLMEQGCIGFKCADCAASDPEARKVADCPPREALVTLNRLAGPRPVPDKSGAG